MLGNNEQIAGVSLPEVFSQMVSELPWKSLETYIQGNSQLLKLCTIGGTRLKPDKRKKFEQVIVREAEKQKFADAVTNAVFAAWYPVHKELHEQLESYYHSDEYKAYRQEHGLDEEAYVLPDEKLDSLFRVDDLKLWKILLCFSPLRFTAEQAARLLNDSTGSEELVERLKASQAECADLTRRNEQLAAEAVRLRTKQNEDAAELQELKKQLRQLKQENEQTAKRLEGAQAEARRVNQQIAQAGSERNAAEEAIKAEMQKAMARVQDDLRRQTEELQSWKSRYEEQRAGNRRLEENVAALNKAQGDLQAQAAAATAQFDEMRRFATLVLQNIDWPRVGAAMKLSATMKRNFNSLVKRLDYNTEDRKPTIEGTLPKFWDKLGAAESRLIKAIAESSTAEVCASSINDYWNGIRDQFAEVQTGLEARIVLLGLLQDIFYQTLESDTLADELPEKAKESK